MAWPKGVKRPKHSEFIRNKPNGIQPPPKNKLEINEELIAKLAAIMCTMEEISAIVGCSVDTLEKRFAEIIKKNREQGKASLRRQQFLSCNNGSVPMQIFLGKVYLKQREIDNEIDEEKKNVQFEFAKTIAQDRKSQESLSSPSVESSPSDVK